MDTVPTVPWLNVTAFVRQHTHDIRNHLNGIDLEAALLRELVTDPEALQGVARLRQQVRDIASELRGLSNRLVEPAPRPTPIAASELFEIWQEQVSAIREPPCDVKWESQLGAQTVHVDAALFASALFELVQNAFHFYEPPGTVTCTGELAEAGVQFAVCERKSNPPDFSLWGRTPLQTTRRGGMGLGLWNVQRVAAASQGRIERRFDGGSSRLRTVVRLPTSAE